MCRHTRSVNSIPPVLHGYEAVVIGGQSGHSEGLMEKHGE